MIIRFLRWLLDATLRTSAGNAVLTLAFILVLGGVSAASWDVTNEPQMNLNESINGTVTEFDIASRQLNGSDYEYNTLSGGMLRIRWGSFREDVYFTEGTRNATTNIYTVSGAIRNVCPHYTDTIVSCGNGRNWGKGAIVELIQDARLFNLKADVDRANMFTASGAIAFSGSGSFTVPTFATTDLRDQQLGASGGDYRMACVTATNACYIRRGGSWTEIGDTGTLAATTTTAGTVEKATVTNISGSVITDDSGAPVALTTDLVIRRSSGAINNRNKLVATNNAGRLSGSLLGSSIGSGEYLRYLNNGQIEWQAILTSTSLVNSGSLTVNSYETGSILKVQKAGTSYLEVRGSMNNGHIKTGGTAPTLHTNCTTTANNAATIVGNDIAGKITMGTGGGPTITNCTMYFNKKYSTAPSCTMSVGGGGIEAGDTYRVSTTNSGAQIALLGGTSMEFDVVTYICLEY